MKLKEAIICDVRKEGAWEELHELLFKIKPFKKYAYAGEVPLEALEKFVWLMNVKHGVQLQYIMANPQQPQKSSKNDSYSLNEVYYSCSLKSKHDNNWIGTVHGKTIYECYVKISLLCYGYVKKNESKK